MYRLAARWILSEMEIESSIAGTCDAMTSSVINGSAEVNLGRYARGKRLGRSGSVRMEAKM